MHTLLSVHPASPTRKNAYVRASYTDWRAPLTSRVVRARYPQTEIHTIRLLYRAYVAQATYFHIFSARHFCTPSPRFGSIAGFQGGLPPIRGRFRCTGAIWGVECEPGLKRLDSNPCLGTPGQASGNTPVIVKESRFKGKKPGARRGGRPWPPPQSGKRESPIDPPPLVLVADKKLGIMAKSGVFLNFQLDKLNGSG